MNKVKGFVIGICFLAMIFAVGCAGAQPAEDENAAIVQDESVKWHAQSGEGEVPGAKARLVRTDGNVNVSFEASDLNPGHVYTLWWVIVNDPEKCAAHPEPCTAADDVLGNTDGIQADLTYGGGIVAGESGTGTLSSHLAVGELSNAWFGNGFDSASDAEIHLVVNDHGPLIPDQAAEMLHTYRGGCTDDSLPPPFPATAKSDGSPGPNTCRLYQVAIFQT